MASHSFFDEPIPTDEERAADDWDSPLSEVQFKERPAYTGHVQKRRAASPETKRMREFAGINKPKKFAKSRAEQKHANRHGLWSA